MTEKEALIQKRLRDEGDKLLAVFEALSPAQWQTIIYTDGMVWTIKDLLAHQISAEREFQYYGCDILDGGQGAPEGFVINDFNNAAVAQLTARDVMTLIADLRATRQTTIDLVASIDEDEFALQGRHPFFGQMTIEDMFKLIYRHNMLHLRDLRRVLDAESTSGGQS